MNQFKPSNFFPSLELMKFNRKVENRTHKYNFNTKLTAGVIGKGKEYSNFHSCLKNDDSNKKSTFHCVFDEKSQLLINEKSLNILSTFSRNKDRTHINSLDNEEKDTFSVSSEEVLIKDNKKRIENELSDPREVPEYIGTILSYLREIEPNYIIDYKYLDHQKELNDKFRSILVDWIIEVSMKFKLRNETLFLTINIVDRYLSKLKVNRDFFQLIGISSMLVASKYEEILAPEIRDYIYISEKEYTKDQIILMEYHVLKALNFDISNPTSIQFVEIYSILLKLDEKSIFFSFYLLELFLVDVNCNKYLPSHIAASSIYITLKIFKKEFSEIFSLLQYSEPELKECARDICLLLDNIDNSLFQTIRKKYSTMKFHEVSKIKFI